MGTFWTDWKVVRQLGEGAFGKVYEVVRDRYGIEERSAMKVISIPSTPSEAGSLKSEGMTDNDITEYYKGLVQDFVQEIALMSKLRGNAHIVGYEDYEVFEHKDRFGWDIYIRMELLTPLTSRMTGTSLPEKDVIDMAIDLCEALEECYNHHIVHRDIKPDNIFISSKGEYKLGDFGVAKTIDKTVSGLSKKGTYTYMAPEIYKGEPAGTNCDIYSLGMVVYRLLNNNREPFVPPAPQPVSYAQKQEALTRRMKGEAFLPPSDGSAAIFEIIKKACAYHTKDRYRTPTQMKEDLIALRKTGTVPASAPAPAPVEDDLEKTARANAVPTPPVKPATETPKTPVTPAATANVPPAKPPKKKNPIVLIVIIVAIVAIIGVGSVFVLGLLDDGGSSKKSRHDDDENTEITETVEDTDTTTADDGSTASKPTKKPAATTTAFCIDCASGLDESESSGLYDGYCFDCYYAKYCRNYDGNEIYLDDYCFDCYMKRQGELLVGHWVGSTNDRTCEATFSQTGEYSMNMLNKTSGEKAEYVGTYTVSEGVIHYDDGTQDEFTVDRDKLYFFSGGDLVIALDRQ